MASEKALTENDTLQVNILINEKTLEAIFHRFYGKLAFYANELLRDEEKAKDAVTNAFLALWEQKDKLEFKNEKLLQAYLYTITRNKAIEFVRAAEKDSTLLKDYGRLVSSIQDPKENDEALMLTEAIAFVGEVINDLPPRYRAVIELTIQGKSHEEIAGLLHMTKVSVRTNKLRAINILKNKLNRFRILMAILLIITRHYYFGHPGSVIPG